jgi:hypothetical protein
MTYILKKEKLFLKLCEIRDKFLKDASNPFLAQAIGKIYIEGYLTALYNTGFMDKDQYEKMLNEWVK